MEGKRVRPGGRPAAILFDLDGTLIDSAPDIATATNILLGREGLTELTIDQVRAMIGNGIKKLVQRAFREVGRDLEDGPLEEMTDRMMAIYGNNLTARTGFMPNAREVLEACRSGGIRVAVVTNKPERFSRTILSELGVAELVDCVVGGDTCPARKPAPDMLLHACGVLGIDKDDAVMIGDSPVDIDAAKNAGIMNIAVKGGYTNVPAEELGADRVIESLRELDDVLPIDGMLAKILG